MPSAKEIADAEKYSWQRYPQHEQVGAGRLQLRHGHDTTMLTDGTLLLIEDRLDEVFTYATKCAGAAKQRAEATERARLQRVACWEVAMADARQHFDKEFLTQARDWRTAYDVCAYCEALTARLPDTTGAQETSLREWIELGRDLADRIDPTDGADKPAPARMNPKRRAEQVAALDKAVER